MREPLLQARLGNAGLVLGDIAKTGADFLASAPPPIGFVSFDLDYYSSTVAASRSLSAIINGTSSICERMPSPCRASLSFS